MSSTLTGTGITTSNNKEIVVVCAALGQGGETASGWTGNFEQDAYQAGSSGDGSIYVASEIQAVAGATGSISAALSNSTDWATVTVGLVPFSGPSLVTVVLTSGTIWTVPSGFTNQNLIQVIGGGGGGGNGYDGGAGGGGGFSQISNLALTPGANITYQIGAGGAGGAAVASNTAHSGANGTATYFNGTSLASSSVGANGGFGSVGGSGGASITGAIGDLVYAGGPGGPQYSAPGGGGAGGPNGNGATGGQGQATGNSGGGGGGGNGGGASGNNTSALTGASGGSNFAGSGSGSGAASNSVQGGAGTVGGGGGGGAAGAAASSGGAGGPGNDLFGSVGSGGGGGSAEQTSTGTYTSGAVGGAGGLYGAGGGNGSYRNNYQGAGGSGAPGVIVISYISPVGTQYNKSVSAANTEAIAKASQIARGGLISISDAESISLKKATHKIMHIISPDVVNNIKTVGKIYSVSDASRISYAKYIGKSITISDAESIITLQGKNHLQSASSSDAQSSNAIKSILKNISVSNMDIVVLSGVLKILGFNVKAVSYEVAQALKTANKVFHLTSSESSAAKHMLQKVFFVSDANVATLTQVNRTHIESYSISSSQAIHEQAKTSKFRQYFTVSTESAASVNHAKVSIPTLIKVQTTQAILRTYSVLKRDVLSISVASSNTANAFVQIAKHNVFIHTIQAQTTNLSRLMSKLIKPASSNVAQALKNIHINKSYSASDSNTAAISSKKSRAGVIEIFNASSVSLTRVFGRGFYAIQTNLASVRKLLKKSVSISDAQTASETTNKTRSALSSANNAQVINLRRMLGKSVIYLQFFQSINVHRILVHTVKATSNQTVNLAQGAIRLKSLVLSNAQYVLLSTYHSVPVVLSVAAVGINQTIAIATTVAKFTFDTLGWIYVKAFDRIIKSRDDDTR